MSSTDNSTIAIIGAGQAGGQMATELRKLGHSGRIVLIGDEAQPPYKRPPLSKAYLAGAADTAALQVVKPTLYSNLNIELMTGVSVTEIDRENHKLTLSNGQQLQYDRLALTTGGRARPLPVPGADADNVYLFRSIVDVDNVRQHCHEGKRVVIVGGGFIGLEVAAVLVKQGLQVTVLEGLDRVLARVAAPPISAFFEAIHRDAGVDLRTGAALKAFEGSPHATAAVLADGTRIDMDFAIVGIGLIPNVELAQAAGLTCENGIVVDEYTRTSDPDIVAAGDCTNHPNLHYGMRVRLESVQNALDQARAAARTLVGQEVPYDALPWFWSDQYDVKLQMAGLSGDADDRVVRGDPAQRSFSVFHLRSGEVIAADAVSKPMDFMMAKKLIANRVKADPVQLADESVALKTLIAG